MEKATKLIAEKFIVEFAELNLSLVEGLKKTTFRETDPAMLRELRQNAQVLLDLLDRC